MSGSVIGSSNPKPYNLFLSTGKPSGKPFTIVIYAILLDQISPQWPAPTPLQIHLENDFIISFWWWWVQISKQ
jgi:hypothetical protein